jgi:hypothetical protein
MTVTRAQRDAQAGTTALVVVIVMPAILFIIASVAQVIAWQFARQAAQQSAAFGVEAARVHGGSDAAGAQRAAESAGQFRSLHGVTVTVAHPRPGIVEVDVTANTATVVPGVSLPISGSATAAQEPVP